VKWIGARRALIAAFVPRSERAKMTPGR